MLNNRDSWWTRPCGGREVLAVALPLFISTGTWSLMMFVDRMFLLWYSSNALAAALAGGMLYWTMICFPVGVAGYVNTFVAQYFGAERPERIGAATWQGMWLGVYAVPFFMGAIPLAPHLFRWSGHDPQVIPFEIAYFQVLCLGAPAAVIAAAQEALFTGRGVTRVVMLVDIATLCVNAVLDYLWIFGKLGFPAGGIEGAALATVVSAWMRVGIYAWLMHREPVRRAYSLATTWRVDRPLLSRILAYGGPNGFQFLVDAAGFALMIMLVGRLGQVEMAATALAFNVNTVAFIPMLGVGIAAGTLVGQQLMRGRPDLATRATWTALTFALAYTALCGLFFLLTPDWFLLGHRAGADPEEFDRLRDLAVVLLRFVAAYCLFDAMQIIFAGAVKGAGDTWFVLLVTLVVSAIGVAVCWLGLDRGLLWWWFVVTGWICTLGVIFCLRFLRGPWREMRVIEREPLETNQDPAAEWASPTKS